MMLKRLNFLRNSLQAHNPRETTQHNREQNLRKRDERILELWKLDQEKPSVYELVQNMKKQREYDNQTAKEFNQIFNSLQHVEQQSSGPFIPKAHGDHLQSDFSSMNDTMSKHRWINKPDQLQNPYLSKTLQENINKGKFVTQSDQDS